jgi:hypothetical protein
MNDTDENKVEQDEQHEDFHVKLYCSNLYCILLTIWFIFFTGGVIGYFPRYTLFMSLPCMLWQWYLLHNVNSKLFEIYKNRIR